MNITSLKATPDRNRFERRKERTRQELLAAAARVLSERGLHDTKVADIAGAADLGVGTFYLHFATKEALFSALVGDTIAQLKATVDAARERAADPVERIRRSNQAFCRFAQANREVFRVVFGHPAAYHDEIRRAQALFAADIEATIRDGVRDGSFAPVPTAVAAQAVVGMATQILSWWSTDGSVPLETLEDTMTHLALRGLSAREPQRKDQP